MEESEIRQWVEENAKSLPVGVRIDSEELDHVAMCLHHIYRWYSEGYPLGGFLTSVVRNNFCEACLRADDINRKVLYLYALFLANHIPYDYKTKHLK